MSSDSQPFHAPVPAHYRYGPPTWLLIALAVAFAGVGSFAAYVLYATVHDVFIGKPIGSTQLSIPVVSGMSNPGTRSMSSDPQRAATELQSQPTWNGSDRVTVLVTGIDHREGEQGPSRTDTMILLSMDPMAKRATVLSIPRDLWVPIADFGRGRVTDRINVANFYGDLYNYPGGGPALAAKTVELNLGVRVDYTVRLNFSAFEQFIDLIGGIDIDVPYDINDPTYPNGSYGYDPFYIKAGHYHMDGATALKYARTRHTTGSDFDRAKRQQQVIMAVRSKILQPTELAGLLLKAPQLFDLFRNNMNTNLTPEQVVALARLAAQIPTSNIHSGAIGPDQVIDWITPTGEDVLVPQRARLAALIAEMFPSIGTPAGEATPASVAQERAVIMVRNGGAPAGSAAQLADYLKSKNYQVLSPGDASRLDFQATFIIVHRQKPLTVQSLADMLDVPAADVENEPDDRGKADIEIIIGSDFQLPGQ